MAVPEIRKIRDNVYMLSDQITHIYIIVGRERAMLIDTGFGSYDLKECVRLVTDLPVIAVNTHGHPDHIGGNTQFETIYVGAREFDTERMLGGKGGPLAWALAPLTDGEIIDLGACPVKVIEIPGHSPGHVAYLDMNNRILFSGDTLQEGPVFMFVPGSDMDTFCRSLEKLRAFAGEFEDVYPAHNKAPVDASYIDELLKLAREVSAGQAEPVSDHFIHEMPCKLYKNETVSLYH